MPYGAPFLPSFLSGVFVEHANPRRAAFRILNRVERERIFAEPLIAHELEEGGIVGPDRGFLTELVYGVLRRRGTLDHLLSQFAGRPVERLDMPLLVLLRLGLYQIRFLDRVPPSAAVNETVKLSKEAVPRASGLVNAVLRRACRGPEEVSWPDTNADPARFIAARHSHPRWLAERWIAELGRDEAEELAEAMSRPAPFTVRTNLLKTTREALADRLAQEGVASLPGRWSSAALHLESPGSLMRIPSFREGLFTVQDEASQLVALLLDPRPGERVLDACAAPGGKATYLAELMENKGTVLACDVAGKKLRLVEEGAQRLGISIIETKEMDAAAGPELPLFDRILTDAPCSGLGVLRRNPEGKWWKTAEDVERLAAAQRRIVESLAERLRKGGVLVYATCSTSRSENEDVIDYFLSRHPEFVIEDVRMILAGSEDFATPEGYFRSWPHRHGMDGFFAVRLKKVVD